MGPHYVNVNLQNISVSRFLVGQKIVQSCKTRQENSKDYYQQTNTCLRSAMKTIEKGVKYV